MQMLSQCPISSVLRIGGGANLHKSREGRQLAACMQISIAFLPYKGYDRDSADRISIATAPSGAMERYKAGVQFSQEV